MSAADARRRLGTALAILGFALVAWGAAEVARLVLLLRGEPGGGLLLAQAGLALGLLAAAHLGVVLLAPGRWQAVREVLAAREARPFLVAGALVLVARAAAVPASDGPFLAALLAAGAAGACLGACGALLASG